MNEEFNEDDDFVAKSWKRG